MVSINKNIHFPQTIFLFEALVDPSLVIKFTFKKITKKSDSSVVKHIILVTLI